MRSAPDQRQRKFRQAAVSYVGLGILVIALTLFAGTSAARGAPPLIGLLIGAIFVAIFGLLVYSYGWIDHGWEAWQRWVGSWKSLRYGRILYILIVVFTIPCLYLIYYLIKRCGGPKIIKGAIEGITGLLVVTNWLRMLQYFVNFLGYRFEIDFRHVSLAIHPSVFSFPLIFLLCAFLMACITYMLARAAWDL